MVTHLLLPGASVLARLVAAMRRGAADRLYGMISEAAAGADPELPERLRRLLAVPVGARYSELERLRRPPRKISGQAMTEALHRAEDVLGIGARKAQVQAVPTNRLKQLARYGLTSKAPLIAQLAEPRQTATLLAAARALEEHAVDDALDLFHVLMATRLISAAKREATSGRLESLPRLERASTTLAATTRAFVEFLESAEDTVSVTEVWAAVEQVASRAEVVGAADVVVELVPDDSAGETAMQQRLAGKYQSVRPFLILLAEALPLGSTPAAADLLAEVRRLPELARRRVSQKPLREAEVNEDLVPRLWQRAVFANHKVNLARIRTRWSDMVRVAGSLVDGRVRAYDLLRMLSREGNPIPLGQAFAEYGRIAKTVHLLALVDPVDETYRRQIGRQQNMTESRHSLARRIYHGQRGQMYKSYRERQEDQLGALGLVLNAVVLWNTRYIDAALAALRGRGETVNIEDAAKLTPLGFEHINMLGRYAFTPPAGTGLRPLRDPAADDEA